MNDIPVTTPLEFAERFEEVCTTLPRLARKPKGDKIVLNPQRLSSIRARMRELAELEITPHDYFERVHRSPFLNGTKTDWSASFDWIIKRANFYKIVEGNYDDRTKKTASEVARRETGRETI